MKIRDRKIIRLKMQCSKYLQMATDAEDSNKNGDALYFYSNAYNNADSENEIYIMQSYSDFLVKFGYSFGAYDLLLKSFIESRFDKTTLLDIIFFLCDINAKDAATFFLNRFLNEKVDGGAKGIELQDGMSIEDLFDSLSAFLKPEIKRNGIREASDYEDKEVLARLFYLIENDNDFVTSAKALFSALPKWQMDNLKSILYFTLIDYLGVVVSACNYEKALKICDVAQVIMPKELDAINIKRLLIMNGDEVRYADEIKRIKDNFNLSSDSVAEFFNYLLTIEQNDELIRLTKTEAKKELPDFRYLQFYADASMKKGNFLEAKSAYVKLLKIDPCSVILHAMVYYSNELLKKNSEFSVSNELSLIDSFCECMLTVMSRQSTTALFDDNPLIGAVVMSYVVKVFERPKVFLDALYKTDKNIMLKVIKEVLFSSDTSLEAKRLMMEYALKHYPSTEFNLRIGFFLHTIVTLPKLPKSKNMCAELVTDLCFKMTMFGKENYAQIAAETDELYVRIKSCGRTYSSFKNKEELFALVLCRLGLDKKVVCEMYSVDSNNVSKLNELLYTDDVNDNINKENKVE